MFRQRKIKPSNIIFQREPCPKCSSIDIADIQPFSVTKYDTKRIEQESLRHDLDIYFVDPTQYRTYYLPYHLNTKCLSCHYEYFSKTQKIKRVKEIDDDDKDINDIQENQNQESHIKPKSKLRRIISILKE